MPPTEAMVTLDAYLYLKERHTALREACEWFMRHHAQDCNCDGVTVDCLGPIDAIRAALTRAD